MTKLLLIAGLLALACRWLLGKWPWQYLGLDRTPGGDPASARARDLLEVPRGADRTQILDAHRRLVVRVHPDKGGSAAQVHEADAARDLLLRQISGPGPTD